jgi:hypothetical protein
MCTLRAIVIHPLLREIRNVWINAKDVLHVRNFAPWCESFLIGERHIFSGTGEMTSGDARSRNKTASVRVPLAEMRGVVRLGIAEAR